SFFPQIDGFLAIFSTNFEPTRPFDGNPLTTMPTTNECQLNTPADWELWKEEFQFMAMAADLWEIVQGREIRIQKPVEPNINSYLCSAAPAQTRSQSQAAEDSQSTVQQEIQGPIDFA